MILATILAVIVAGITIESGISALKSGKTGNIKKAISFSVAPFSLAIVAMLGFITFDMAVLASPTAAEAVVSTGISMGEGFKYLAASLSTGLATIGTGRAVGAVGSAAIGAVSEDPAILGKTLIFVGMAEGIAIYGMIISILILFV
ncbi:ATPase [Candidatus Epulonipiscium fishelsonii]|uniref:ATPase n=1 Tax=Candidatus Epulonipiscium fishelsonii TaxID=77094 RepID=A0ACC8XG89_9FIRM|nr:ATPase [Epulopiscium sp. SCG-B05WGA-EpuloA1]ONI42501.1 ATPase [Epulopiscium sp. SCG-B11WGA-EpuloA1]